MWSGPASDLDDDEAAGYAEGQLCLVIGLFKDRPMNPSSSDRNLLFGILALQVNFIGRDALIKAMNTWVLEKRRPLGAILVEQGALLPERRDMLEAMVCEHLKVHDDDPQKSLAAISSVSSVRKDLEQIADADVQASVGHVRSTRNDADPWRTADDPIPPPPEFAIRYKRLRPHAKGGLGEVFVALDEELQREVALKEIQSEHADRSDSRARFLLEAEITGKLEHPGIVPVYGLGTYPDGRPFYAMRFIKGDSLKEAIERFHKTEGPNGDPGERTLALRLLLGRFVDVCNAIAYAHSRGVLHRDLKPGNVMLGKYGETLVVDWGMAKSIDRPEAITVLDEQPLRPSSTSGSAQTVPGSAVGTPAYMSPEQAAGRLDLLGPRSDVYSLGATLYCLLTGKVAFEGEEVGAILREVQTGNFPPPRQIESAVPVALDAVCRKAMELRPEDRYPTPRTLAADIENWLADEPVTAYGEPLRVRAGRWLRRHQTVVSATAAAVLVALLLGGGGAFVWQRQRARQQAEQARQEGQTRQAVESALAEVTRFQERARWDEARVTLEQAVSRLVDGKPEDLNERLEQARRDLELIARYDAISQKAATLVRQGLNFGTADKDCAAAFQEAGFGGVSDAPSDVAEKVRASSVRVPLVAALDYWTICARDPAQRAWVLEVARLADPDPWRDQARDPATWNDVAALARLAREAPLDQWTPQLLSVVGARLRGVSEGQALLRRAQQRYPDDFWINFALGFALEDVKPEEALGYYRAALALRPATPALLNSIGELLSDLGRRKEALQAYRRALSLDPKFAYARHNCGIVLKELGKLEEARDEFSEAVTHGHRPAIQYLRHCQQLIAIRKRLPAVLAGKDRPNDAAELLALAILCQSDSERRYVASAGFYAEAFRAKPPLARDLGTNNRYNAACSAVLAGFGQGVDGATLDEAAKAKFRRQALDWLNADLALWSKLLNSWFPSSRAKALEMLRHWRLESDLLNVRYAGFLATISAAEREEWVKLWGEVEASLKKASGATAGVK
jgi:serine/threonine protein kinase/tetratricopeptide (TPR) repeat protein